MFNKLFENIKSIDKKIKDVMLKGFKFSFILCILSTLVLATYSTYPYSNILFESGIILFRTSLMFAVYFFICGMATNTIKKDM